MSQDLLDIFLLALLAACYPTLLAAVTVMLLLPNPKRLMLGYLLGAYTTGITLGLVIVLSLQGSSFESTSHHTVSPGEDIAVGLVLLVVALVLRGGHDARLRERRRRRKEEKRGDAGADDGAPWMQRMLGRGSARITYVVGVVLSFPGLTYLAALHRISALDAALPATILLVVGFCLIQQLPLELPLLVYVFAPAETQERVERFRAWLGAQRQAR
jgi:Sap, sulfolipid-1-addressing protein